MNSDASFDNCYNQCCPDLRIYWQIEKIRNYEQFILKSKDNSLQFRFNATEGYALQHFNGQWTIEQVQKRCTQKFGEVIYADFLEELLHKLVTLGILVDTVDENSDNIPTNSSNYPHLKAYIQWIAHPEGYWILRNPEDVTYLELDKRCKIAIELIGKIPLSAICQKCEISPEQLRYLLQLLTATAMLEGTKPPKPPRKKFTPLQLISFKVRLFNPDTWLNKPASLLHWVWTMPVFLCLCLFIACSTVVGLDIQRQLIATGSALMSHQGAALMLPFGLLVMLVVTIHELGHALTLKHYGGIVPEVGLLFMFFIPAAYTNTTDAYCLVKRRQRVFVVAAGVLTQLVIGALALWLWCFSVESSWLHHTSYLLLIASLFTVAVNLNPLSKFDGYYLAIALSGINNLRSRSFGFYANLLKGNWDQEKPSDRFILAVYAPFSLLYTLLVFGSLLSFVIHWIVYYIPMTAIIILLLWAIYYIFPRPV
ncbi:M50 family metallopeptidase [Nostoc sp.]|uniref:M50 family metallopeptidase n=1 Tax=Nostoc sp. TaxID=1180 RepID=UPI002FF940CA